jgi:hypothetical protein
LIAVKNGGNCGLNNRRHTLSRAHQIDEIVLPDFREVGILFEAQRQGGSAAQSAPLAALAQKPGRHGGRSFPVVARAKSRLLKILPTHGIRGGRMAPAGNH